MRLLTLEILITSKKIVKSISKQLHKDVKLLCQYIESNLVVLKSCCHLHTHHVLLILGFNNLKEYNSSCYHCLFRNPISLDHSFIYCYMISQLQTASENYQSTWPVHSNRDSVLIYLKMKFRRKHVSTYFLTCWQKFCFI